MRRRCHYLLLATLSVVPFAPAHGQRSALPSPEKPSPRLRSMHLTGQVTGVIQEAFHLYGVSVVFVPPIEGLTRPIAVNLTDADLATTAEVLDAMAHCFFVPVNENTVLAVQDDKAHRSHYERLFTETIVIPNLQAGDTDERSEVAGLLSSVFGITKSTLRGNAVTVRATKRDLLQIEDTLTHLFQPQPQVLLEIKAYIVSRNHNRDLGVQTPQRIKIFNVDSEAESLISSNSSVVAELIKAGTVTAGDTLGIAEALIAEGYGSNSVLSSSFVTLGGGITSTGVQFGSVPANASLTTSSSQQLQSALLQLGNAQTGKLRVGQRYPVETASTKALGWLVIDFNPDDSVRRSWFDT
jgi:general secretion pathway protein D